MDLLLFYFLSFSPSSTPFLDILTTDALPLMGAPDRSFGLTIHLLYPLISCILLAVAAFASADSVWYVSANTPTLTVSMILF